MMDITQTELAKRAGTTGALISRLEKEPDRGNLQLDNFVPICKALGVDPTTLLQEAGLWKE